MHHSEMITSDVVNGSRLNYVWDFPLPWMILFLSAKIMPRGKYQLVHKVNEAFKTDEYFADVLVAFWREMKER